MKIGDIEVGTEYGLSDNPRSSYGALPRQAEVLEIVKVEEKVWNHNSFANPESTRSMRRVKVKLLGPPLAKSNWGREKIATGAEGAEIVVEARQVQGLWKDLRAGVKDVIDRKRKVAETEADLTARLEALGFKVGWGDTEISINDQRPQDFDIEFNGAQARKLLAKLEA